MSGLTTYSHCPRCGGPNLTAGFHHEHWCKWPEDQPPVQMDDCPGEMVDQMFADDLRQMICEEIDRLYEKIADLKDDLRKEWLLGYQEEGEQIGGLKEDLAAANKRVEELEKRLMIEVVPPYNMHIITEAKIDAAWSGTNVDCLREEDYAAGCLWALEIFGIVQCEECGGSGKTQETIDPTMYGEPVHIFSSCKGCNGHGWVVKDESNT